MMKKILFVALILCCSTDVLSLRFYTQRDKLCTSECAKRGQSYYWCYYNNDWDYCSPLKNMDYKGRLCRDDHPCGKHGYSYSWCYVDSDKNWGYCGAQGKNLQFIASNGYFCIDECRYYSPKKYYWCNTQNGWQYCSPTEGKDYRGRKCRRGHFCDKYGYSSYWCYVDSNNNWGYCGIIGDSKHLTSKGYYCETECEKNGKKYNWCRLYKGWDYCSLTENTDSHGRACREDHDCARHGKEYTWCYTDSTNNWDRCGLLSDCSYLPAPLRKSSERVKRQEELCRIDNRGNNIYTTWTLENTGNINNDVNKNVLIDADRAISQWDQTSIAGNSQSRTLLTYGRVRVDLQGMINRGGRRYANIQIQINGPRPPGTSTTIAALLLQADVDMPVRYIRKALLYSLSRHGTVVLQVQNNHQDVEAIEQVVD